MKGRGAGGQARRRKEVSRRFIHYYFWLNETWEGHQIIWVCPPDWHTWWLTLINIDSWSFFLGEPRHLTSFNQVCQSPGVFTNIPHVLMPPPSPRCRGFLLRHLKAGIKSGKLFGKCFPPKKCRIKLEIPSNGINFLLFRLRLIKHI